ncbi:MAG: hypothetical protein ACOC00_00145 [Halothiobacillaceae bacterium]
MIRFVLAMLLVLVGCIPVRVTNTPDRPVPTAPMGESIETGEGRTQYNPQLGPPPEASAYETRGFPFMKAAAQAATGNWIGLAGTVVAAVAGGGMVHQRRRRQRAETDRDRLAVEDPERARIELEEIKRRGG